MTEREQFEAWAAKEGYAISRVPEGVYANRFTQAMWNGWLGRAQNNQSPRMLDALRMLGNLLARIHRDGGHYVFQHGLEKAVEDAEKVIADLYARS